jgi:hypothetical protein
MQETHHDFRTLSVDYPQKKGVPMHNEFEGSWLATASGGMWSIENPQEDQVQLRDIAAGLSRTCRYAGQISEEAEFYSVAEHSVIMTSWAHRMGRVRTRSEALLYLLHDGSEAYFGDMPTPLKALIPDFRRLEDRAQNVIYRAFGIRDETVCALKPELKRIDTRVRMDEREVMILEPALGAGREALWKLDPDLEPLGVKPLMMSPFDARETFLRAFCWALQALPDDLGETRALRGAAIFLQDREIIPEIPDFSTNKEASCETAFSPC